MLTEEDDVEIAALARRGWSVSAIARHTGRDRKTIRKYLKGQKPSRGRSASCLEPFREYLAARFAEDAHVEGTVLFREVVELGFDRSYPTFVRELRLLGLRPRCEACRTGGHGLTTVIAHEPGEEIQWDWLELHETPWGAPAYVLVGALSFAGKCRAVICEGQSFAHLVEGIDGVLRRLGGTSRAWRTDRMATVVYPGTDRITDWVCAGRKALRRRGLDLPAAAAAAQGRGGGGDQIHHALVVAHRAGREPGPGAGRPRPLGRGGLRPPQTPGLNDRRACRPGEAAGAARRRVPGAAGGPADRLAHGDGRLRGQQLQRPARPGRPDRDGSCALRGASPGDPLPGRPASQRATVVPPPAPDRSCRQRSTHGCSSGRC